MEKSDIATATLPNHHTINFIEPQSTSIMGHNIVSHHQYPSTRNTGASQLFEDTYRETHFGSETLRELLDDEKTMDQTLATAPTQFTDIVGAMGHIDDDDTTTIQSHDSITGAGLLDTTDDGDEPHDYLHHAAALNPPLIPSAYPNGVTEHASSVCSVSTAPSTDEASSLGHQNHRRVPSWEVSPHNLQQLQSGGGRVSPAAFNLTPAFSPSTGWSSTGNPHHKSTFQNESVHQNYAVSLRLNATANHWSQPQSNATRQGINYNEPSSPRGMAYRQQINVNNYPYPVQQIRKTHHQPPLPPSSANTPPRMNASTNDRITRNVTQNSTNMTGQSPHRSLQSQHGNSIGIGSGGGSSRSSSEVLKTLLRKKACLYEPDTSRAVALATWLVGRELALEFGYFSRQQLQAGVHACVSSKIESGVITRTKVNRCMQIILNSCFHYIIPRSDGSEESGESIRKIFSKVMKNDSYLLTILPSPWNDIKIDKDAILAACEEEAELQKHHKKFETPQSSPRFGSVQAMGSPGAGESVDGDHDSKRAVLLCFNENVRSAEEVFRCHNEFIRDTAHACHLQLSSNEWRLFFGKEASSAPHLWGNVGIPVPHLEGHGPQHTDALGMLTSEEAGVFRTSWCSKRYDHDHELCGFGHVEVNGGWLRRNPLTQSYSDEICQFISTVPITSNELSSTKYVTINECPHGLKCSYAHSNEEIKYHPRRYKQRACNSMVRASGCLLGDVCPSFHPIETYRFPKKADSRSARYARQGQTQMISNVDKGNVANTSYTGALQIPVGSPVIYTSPAPFSSYEQHLLLPGLQSLYRRQGAFVRANLRKQSTVTMHYNCFDDGCIRSLTSPPQYTSATIIRPHTNTHPATIAELSR